MGLSIIDLVGNLSWYVRPMQFLAEFETGNTFSVHILITELHSLFTYSLHDLYSIKTT